MLLRLAIGMCLVLGGCATFAEERPPRIRHDAELFFVTLLERGRIHETTVDGKRVQAMAAAIFARERGIAWSRLAAPGAKQLVRGAVDPLMERAERPSHRVFLLELRPDATTNQLEAFTARIERMRGGELDWLAQEERTYLAKLDQDSSLQAAVVLVCIPLTAAEPPCISPPKAYTLIIGDQWAGGSALKLTAGRRSKPLSAGLGVLFLLSVVGFAVF